MKMAAFGGNTKFKGHDPIIYRRLQEQENFLQSPLTVQTPTMPDQQKQKKSKKKKKLTKLIRTEHSTSRACLNLCPNMTWSWDTWETIKRTLYP